MLIQHLHLFARNLAKQRFFYTQTLGLALVQASPTSFTIQTRSSHITFTQTTEAEALHYHFAFNIPENQLSQAKTWLQARTSLLMKDGVDQFVFAPGWNAEGIYFQDPEENVLEFICRHNLATTSAAPFGPESILGVSEIGLVVPEVSSAVHALFQMTGLRVWQEAGPDFKAVGDETGLFIVVQEGRVWFPTQILAQPINLRVTFTQHGKEYQLQGAEGSIQITELIPEKEEILA
ncbi:VOC family protein [Rufibacter hautae]|uniref:VOC domain-containing protein n=1 Tax=Rufibacter hautae TaxID=2595005 RepID=A0A5B6TH82_9BACT|nr:VOC family protein [Rufibacter hautae]KAA3438614.1 hypothetical protein FOA19_15440 [Rufibacter hautae]